jgi:hypothetical protein
MKQSFRTIAMMFALTVAAAPMMHAEPMGTNPRPQTVQTSAAVTIAYAILAVIGH